MKIDQTWAINNCGYVAEVHLVRDDRDTLNGRGRELLELLRDATKNV